MERWRDVAVSEMPKCSAIAVTPTSVFLWRSRKIATRRLLASGLNQRSIATSFICMYAFIVCLFAQISKQFSPKWGQNTAPQKVRHIEIFSYVHTYVCNLGERLD